MSFLPNFDCSTNKVEILLKADGGVPVFPRPSVICLAYYLITFTVKPSTPFEVYHTIFRYTNLNKCIAGEIVNCEP